MFENSILRNGAFQENKIKKLIFKNADLTQVQFLKTSLKGIDLSNSIISGIIIAIEDIRGATINELQALDLVGLIGVKIK